MRAAYRPGTSIGATGAKSRSVFQSVENERQLPQHDFADSRLFVTPSSHRYIDKKEIHTDEQSRMVTSSDQSIVFARPKAFVSCTGTTWMNEEMVVRHHEPDLYEIPQETYTYTKYFRGFCAMIIDKSTHIIDSTVHEDLRCVTNDDACQFREYEHTRLKNMVNYLSLALEYSCKEKASLTEKEQPVVHEIAQKTESLISAAKKLQMQVHVTGHSLIRKYDALKAMCHNLQTKINNLNLPLPRPNVYDLTDGGPGVSVTNHEVRYRAAERIRIHNLDRYGRSHMSTHDQGKNEAERTNAAIGNALCDGGPLPWQYVEPFPDGNVENVTLEEYKEQVEEAMKQNAGKVCDEVVIRIDDAPGPGCKDFLKAFKTPSENEMFFSDKDYMNNYIHKPKRQKRQAPGHGYYSQIKKFLETQLGNFTLNLLR
jgi:hypothetical protein